MVSGAKIYLEASFTNAAEGPTDDEKSHSLTLVATAGAEAGVYWR